MTAARFVDFHILHPIPASNLNRSDTQEPKTFEFGGTTRIFGSSQSWKRPIRLSMEDDLAEYAARTRMVPVILAERLREAGWSDELAAFAAAEMTRAAGPKGLKTDAAQEHRTQAMLYLPTDVIDDLVALCHDHRPALQQAAEAPKKPAATKTTTSRAAKSKDTNDKDTVLPRADVGRLLTRRTATINLFGRMLAEIPDGGHVDGAVQIAPAFSVHKADLQPDFFTSVEDWPQPGERGSAHLQTAFLTAGVLYRFASVNVTELTHNLGGDTEQTHHLLGLFAEAFILTMPQAKKNSTAPHTVPDLVHYAVRDRRPVSYAAAFERPVKADFHGGHTQPARTSLAAYATAMDRLIGTRRRVAHGHAGLIDKPITALGTHHTSFDDLIEACVKAAATPNGAH